MVVWFLFQRLEHEKLLENLGLTGLPDLSCKEHLIHHCVHLKMQGQGAGLEGRQRKREDYGS